MFFVVLYPGTHEGSTGSGSGFKTSQKTGQRLKVSSDRQGEAGMLFVAFLKLLRVVKRTIAHVPRQGLNYLLIDNNNKKRRLFAPK